MMHVYTNEYYSSSTQLGIYICELEHQEKEYEQFRIRIKDNDWLLLPVLGLDTYESCTGIFYDLKPFGIYEIEGEVKYQGNWISVHGASFCTNPNSKVGVTFTTPVPIRHITDDIDDINFNGGKV
jgi:hypothetical protein